MGEAEELPLSSAVQRRAPAAGSKALMRVSLAPAGADMTTAPSEATRGLAPVGASSAALHFTTPVCPASAYSASPAKYTLLSAPSAGEERGQGEPPPHVATLSCVLHASAPF